MENQQAAAVWLAAHTAEYNQLFDDGLALQEAIAALPETVALTALARNARLDGKRSSYEKEVLGQVGPMVDSTLAACSSGVFGPDLAQLCAGEDLWGTLTPSASRIIAQWQLARLRQKTPPLFQDMPDGTLQPQDVERQAPRLVVTACAALVSVLEVAGPRRKTNTIGRWAINGVGYYGPDFTRKFIRGEDVHAALGPDGMRLGEQFNPAQKRSILDNHRDVIGAMGSMARNMEQVTPALLVKTIHWPKERIAELFTPAVLKKLSSNYPGQPLLETCKRVAYIYDNVLTDQNIAIRLGLEEGVVAEMFRPGTRRTIALSSPYGQPIDRLRKITIVIKDLNHRVGVPLSLAAWMAVQRPGKVRQIAQAIVDGASARPAACPPLLWAWIVARFPAADDPRRESEVMRLNAHWHFMDHISGSWTDWEWATQHKVSFDGSDLRRDIVKLTGNIMHRAGITTSQKKMLLEYFADADAPTTEKIAELLQRIRHITAKGQLAAAEDWREDTLSMEKIDEWMATHAAEYAALFDDGHTPIITPMSDWPLSKLARDIPVFFGRSSPRPSIEKEMLSTVERIIDACNKKIFGQEYDLFSAAGLPQFDELCLATARAISYWEVSGLQKGRQRLVMPFDNIERGAIDAFATRLVVMTAASIVKVVRTIGVSTEHTTPLSRWVVRGVACYGPSFVRKFVGGEDVSPVLGADSTRAQQYLLPVFRRRLLEMPRTMPKTIRDMVANVESVSVQTIAASLQWTEEKTELVFTRSVLYQVALNVRNVPLMETCRRIGYLIDVVLTRENIAEQLGVPPLGVPRLFPSFFLREVAIDAPYKDPLVRLQRILKNVRQLTKNYAIPYSVAVWLARFSPKRAESIATAVIREQASPPRYASPLLWAWAVAHYPTPGDKRRDTYIAACIAYRNFVRDLSGGYQADLPFSGTDKDLRYADATYQPESVMFGEDEAVMAAAETAYALIEKAGLTNDQRESLLDYFANPSSSPPESIVQLVQKLKGIAQVE